MGVVTIRIEMPERDELPYTPCYTETIDLAVVRQLLASGRSSDIGWHLVPALQELVKAYDEGLQPTADT